jgi:hypothetical protein
LAFGTEDDSVIKKPLTELLSEAVKLFTGTVKDVEFDGIEKDVTFGGVLSGATIVVDLIRIFDVNGSRVRDCKTCFP